MCQAKKPAIDKKQGVVALYDIWPWIAIIVVIIAAAVIRGQLLSIPFERDEGEYAYIAQQMLNGVPPYVSAYSMKLPGIYVVYALIMAVFGQTHTAVHLGLLIFNAVTIFVIFLLARRFFGPLAAVASGCAYAVLSMTAQVSGLWANAEHFVVLPALAGLLLICNSNGKIGHVRLLIAGLLFGFAFIIKQHGIFFPMFGALYLLYSGLCNKPIKWIKVIVTQVVFVLGAVTPFVLVCFFFWRNGTFDKFWFWTFTYARGYATAVPLDHAWELFAWPAGIMLEEGFPIWFLSIIGFFAVIVIKRYRRWAVLAAGFFVFSFLAVCPGFYFREHYFIFLLPAAAILAGAGLAAIDVLFQRIMPALLCVIVTIVIGSIVAGYSLYNQRVYLFDNSPETVCRMVYGNNPFPESLRIAEFIRDNSRPDDTVAVIGSEPQIYFYSGRRSATSYIYAYPLMESHPYAQRMQQEMIAQIEAAKPEFVVFVSIPTSWLSRPDSVKDIFNWFNSYVNNFYDLVGMIEIPSSGRAIYYWNSRAAERTQESPFGVVVFKRRH